MKIKKLLTVFLLITTASSWANDEAKTRALQNEAKAKALSEAKAQAIENEAKFRAIRDRNLLRMQEIERKGNNENLTYAQQIRNAIKPNIIFKVKLEEQKTNIQTTVLVELEEDGLIKNRKIIASSGNDDWDASVLNALDKTQRIPIDVNGKVPPILEISFRPN